MRLTIAVLGLLFLGGCQLTAALKPPGADALLVSEWLQASEKSAALTPEEARKALVGVTDSERRPSQRFRFALLNQQLGERDGWVVARDRLRKLSQDARLPADARRLAGLLERLNQLRINADQQSIELQSELAQQTEMAQQSQAQAEQLEEKIRALTNLEDSMRQRREKRNGKL